MLKPPFLISIIDNILKTGFLHCNTITITLLITKEKYTDTRRDINTVTKLTANDYNDGYTNIRRFFNEHTGRN